MTDDARFWAKVQKTSTCWLWTGAVGTTGYGNLNRGPRGSSRTFKAHRYSMMLAGVAIEGWQIDHICHVRLCVRPDHLRLATTKQNTENVSGLRADNTSGYRGVLWDRANQRWKATVYHHGRANTRYFRDLDEAGEWSRAKRIELFTHNDLDRAS